MGWFDNVKSPKLKSAKKVETNTPSGVWKKCSHCNEIVQSDRLEENQLVCPYCDHHFRVSAEQRISWLFDSKSFKTLFEGLETTDPLEFEDKKLYQTRLKDAQKKTGKTDGTICGHGTIHGQKAVIAIMDFSYMGGSMGVVTGEKIARVFDYAREHKMAAIVLSCSGGARMQEGILSLMQMGKTSAARHALAVSKTPYISVLSDPTTGGCAASFAMLGDVILAEPQALIGFAGPRVIEQSIRQVLPKGFQRSEFLHSHGMIDRVVHRGELKNELAHFIKALTPKS